MSLQFRTKLREASADDLTAFAEYINPEYVVAEPHIYLCDRLMDAERGDLMRVIISLPPGAAKSTYCSNVFPAWYLGKNPRNRFIQAGHTQSFVESQFGKKVRDIVASQEFMDVFPEVKMAIDSRSSGRWNLNNPVGGYIAKGVGQGIAGFRGNIGVVDDPFKSREDAESETIREKTYTWYHADFSTRMLPNSPIFVVATRWHSDDLCGRLERDSKEGKGIPYEVVNIPALCIDPETDVLKRQEGESLWPNYYSQAFYLDKKSSLSARDWNSLYQGEPMDTTGSVVNAEWFRRYKMDPRKDPEIKIKRIALSLDTANKADQRNDYSVLSVWAEDVLRNHYLIDVIRKKMEFNELCTTMLSTAERYNVSIILVEDKGSGTQLLQSLRGKSRAPMIPIQPGTDSKEFRFDSCTPMFESGRVFLPEHALWLPDYEKELLAFPVGKHDDQVDSTSQYLNWAASKRTAGGTKKVATTAGTPHSSRVAAVEKALEKMIQEREAKRLNLSS